MNEAAKAAHERFVKSSQELDAAREKAAEIRKRYVSARSRPIGDSGQIPTPHILDSQGYKELKEADELVKDAQERYFKARDKYFESLGHK